MYCRIVYLTQFWKLTRENGIVTKFKTYYFEHEVILIKFKITNKLGKSSCRSIEILI